ncbi:MAG: hypothetical protein IPK10_01070 [Bacteroidetes bacterium]|nr:hypothetical protein [Bacteroidota bacterium]
MQLDNRNKFLILFIFLSALTRFFPPIANFTPLAAMALFGGTYLINKKWAFIIPLTAIFISDIIFEIYNGTGFYPDMIFVYGSMALITCLGFYLRGREQRQTIMVASLTGSIIFFLLTNFGTWTTGYYGYTASGLMNCYVAGIPFFKGTLIGDLFYNIVFFGGFALASRMTPILVKKG